MNAPLGDEPSTWLTGDVSADALLAAISAIESGEHDEVKAVRPVYLKLNSAHRGLSARGLLVLDAGLCIITPGYALQMHRRDTKRLARKANGYRPEDEAYIRNLLIEKLTILVARRATGLGTLIKEYGNVLDWEKDQAEQRKLIPA